MVKPCLDLIDQNKMKADLYSVPVLKTNKNINFIKTLKKYSKVITVEEHSIYGGLGDIIASNAAEIGNIQVKKIGIEDRFSQHCGTYQYLMKEHGLCSESIFKKITAGFD